MQIYANDYKWGDSVVQKAIFSSDAIIQPRMAQAGKVKIQVKTIFLAIPHRTAERRLVAPTPMMAALIQCVVLTGIPRCEATSITVAAEASAANPWTGRKVVTLNPSVLITRHPPIRVPKLIEAAETITAQKGIWNSPYP